MGGVPVVPRNRVRPGDDLPHPRQRPGGTARGVELSMVPSPPAAVGPHRADGCHGVGTARDVRHARRTFRVCNAVGPHDGCVDAGIVPQAWKHANISPIFKKGSKRNPGNYRPVSLTSICCKILESIIRKRIVDHMTKHNMFTEHQHGFMKRRSCTTQLLQVLETWTECLDQGQCIDVVYFDFQKAFDTVCHKRLITKLVHYGIGGNILSWIKSFLTGRQQCVTVNGVSSAPIHVTSGVPQGSVLGLVLFIIFINDLPNAVQGCLKLFADDTKLFRTVVSTPDCEDLQADINAMEDWSNKWLLKFHPQKCKVMRIGNQHPNYQYSMLGHNQGSKTTLDFTESEKDLGVNVDNTLSFRDHVKKIVAKANQTTGFIRRTFKYMDKEMFCHLFKARVHPLLEYAKTAWHPRYKTDNQAIEPSKKRRQKWFQVLLSCHTKTDSEP